MLLRRTQRIKLTCTILDEVAETVDDTPYIISPPLLSDPRLTSKYWQEMEKWEDSCWELAERAIPSRTMSYALTGEGVFKAYLLAHPNLRH